MSEEKVEKLQQEETMEAQEGTAPQGAVPEGAELTDEQAEGAAGGGFWPQNWTKKNKNPYWGMGFGAGD